jgi:hypothetical protein
MAHLGNLPGVRPPWLTDIKVGDQASRVRLGAGYDHPRVGAREHLRNNGAIVVYDAATFAEVKRIPAN